MLAKGDYNDDMRTTRFAYLIGDRDDVTNELPD